MISTVILILIGVLVIVFGFQHLKKEKALDTHSYVYSETKREEKKNYGVMSGYGVMGMGAGMVLSGIFWAITVSRLSFIFMGIGFLAGFVLLIYSGQDNQKY